MNIQIINKQTETPIPVADLSQFFSSIVTHSLLCESIQTDGVNIYFVDKEEISALHDDYFQDPTPTDCISFPIDEPSAQKTYEEEEHCLGEVFVCPTVALEYAQEHEEPFLEELVLYVVHGLLHLIGYDDIDENDRLQMRQAEQRLMTHLRKNNLLSNQQLT